MPTLLPFQLPLPRMPQLSCVKVKEHNLKEGATSVWLAAVVSARGTVSVLPEHHKRNPVSFELALHTAHWHQQTYSQTQQPSAYSYMALLELERRYCTCNARLRSNWLLLFSR